MMVLASWMAGLTTRFERCNLWEQKRCLCEVWEQERCLVRPLVLGSILELERFWISHFHFVLHLESKAGIDDTDLGLVPQLYNGQ